MNGVLSSLIALETIGLLGYAIVLAFILWITNEVYRKFRTSKSGYGTIFDSVTGKPIDLARVRLVDIHGLTVASAVTDRYGHYRLAGSPGEFTLDVLKPDYEFPSRFLKQFKRSRMYDNVLSSKKIKIKDYGIVTKNIPIDAVGDKRRSKVFSKWIILSDNAQLAIAYVGPLVAWVYPAYITKTPGVWLLYGTYISITAIRVIGFRPSKPQFGTVTDANTGEPIERAVIRLFDSRFNKVLNTQMTSGKGRYAFLVNKGSYYLTMEKEGYKTLRLNLPSISKDSYPLATDVRMEKRTIEK